MVLGINMEIKLIPKEDLRDFWKIQKQYLKKYSFDCVRKDYSKNKNLYVGCYKQQELIGIAHGFVKKNMVILSGIAVKHEYWKKGIGAKLLSFFEKQAKKTGKKKITIGAANFPIDVVGFYEKSGYKVVKRYKKYTIVEKEI